MNTKLNPQYVVYASESGVRRQNPFAANTQNNSEAKFYSSLELNILVTTQYINRYLSLDKYTKVNVKSIHSSECNVIDSVVEVKVSKMITPQYKSEWLSRRNKYITNEENT